MKLLSLLFFSSSSAAVPSAQTYADNFPQSLTLPSHQLWCSKLERGETLSSQASC